MAAVTELDSTEQTSPAITHAVRAVSTSNEGHDWTKISEHKLLILPEVEEEFELACYQEKLYSADTFIDLEHSSDLHNYDLTETVDHWKPTTQQPEQYELLPFMHNTNFRGMGFINPYMLQEDCTGCSKLRKRCSKIMCPVMVLLIMSVFACMIFFVWWGGR